MLEHMRTTLNIDDTLMKSIREKASSTGQTITQVIEDLLRRELAGEKPSRRRKKFRLNWVTVSGRFIHGVDLSDRDSLYEAMEGRK